MEEPLLGSKRRRNSPFTPALSQIPEDSQAINPQTLPIPAPTPSSFRGRSGNTQISPILVPSPSVIKERLIFGSPDPSLQFRPIWDEYSFPYQQTSDGTTERHLVDHGDEVCTCENTSMAMGGPFRQTQSKNFDDSFLDNTMIESGCSEGRSSANLTRLDLDVKTLTPRDKTSDPWLIGFGKGFSRGNLDRGSKDVFSDSIPASLESPLNESSMKCNVCTKKQYHRSKTAPAIAVLEDRAVPHAQHARSELQPSMTPGSVVTQAFIGLLLYLSVGVVIYIWKRDEFSGSTTYDLVDAIYFCIVTLCTIGYGDITPTSPLAKVFSCVFVLVGFGFIDILLSSMVNYVLDRQEVLLLNSVTGNHHERAQKYLVDIKKGRMRIRMKVALAFGVVIACIGVGTIVMHFLESLGWLDSLYLACMSVTTVGYGDHAFTTLAGRLFASLWLLVSTLAVARSFLYLAEARIDRRHRLFAKLVLKEQMTVGDLVAADLDDDGSISKAEFIVYKLKRMGTIEDKDIAEVCRQFNTVADSSGKITLSCLIDLHESSVDSK